MSILKPGLNSVSNAVYHGDTEYLSSSVLKKLLKDPAEYEREYIKGIKPEKKQSNALDEGTLTHAVILEPETVNKDFQFYPGAIKAGAEYQKWLSESDPKKPIFSTPQKERVNGLVAAYKKHPSASTYIDGAEVEYTICAEIAGVKVKVRFDATKTDQGFISDIKTTGYPGDLDSFRQTVKDLDYGLSAALYTMVAEQHFGRPFDFYFIVLSKKDFTCHIYKASEKTLEEGRRNVLKALQLYKECKATGVWQLNEQKKTVQAEVEEV